MVILKTLLVVIVFLTIIAISQLASVHAIAYFPPPLAQIRSGTAPENVTCTEGLQLVFKSTNGNPACVKHSSVEKLAERGWGNKVVSITDSMNSEQSIKVTNSDVSVNYVIIGGKILNITSNVSTNSLLISLESIEDGQLTITVPQTLIDALLTMGKSDSFFVLVDREERSFEETKTDIDRTFTISFNRGTQKIEIIGIVYP